MVVKRSKIIIVTCVLPSDQGRLTYSWAVFQQCQILTTLLFKTNLSLTPGVWKRHLTWNLNILQSRTYRNRALKRVASSVLSWSEENHVVPETFEAQFSSFGWIFAMIHLPTKGIYVTNATRRIYTSAKKHWYGWECHSSKFHKLLGQSKIQDLFIWPLERVENSSSILKGHIKHRFAKKKEYWISRLLGSRQQKESFQSIKFSTNSKTLQK